MGYFHIEGEDRLDFGLDALVGPADIDVRAPAAAVAVAIGSIEEHIDILAPI